MAHSVAPTAGACKSLARELATFKVEWQASEPEQVDGPEMWRAQDAIRTAHRAAYDPPAERRERRDG